MAYIYKAGSQALADLQKQQELQRQTILNANKQQNNGGFIGGVGYVGEKIGLGALSWAEGMTDFIGSSFAKWFGDEEAAKRILANDWVNYNDADEWYNPGKGMQLVGDVANGIGYSLPSMAVIAGVTLLTAGTGTGAVAAAETASAATKGAKVASVLSKIVNPNTIATFTTSFLPAAGNAAKEAYRQTGEIGGKEYRYALASGALEGGVEAFSDMVFGAGIGGIGKMLGKSLAGKAGMESLGKTVAKSFISEGAEELVSGIFEPMIKRATYDPNAQNATAGELAYQALVGGLSGAIMGGTTKVGIDARNAVRGANIVKEGKANSIINSANAIVEGYRKQGLQLETVDNLEGALKQLNDSVAKTGGNIETVTQKNLLGYIENATFAAYSDPIVMRAARDVVVSAPSLADAFNKYYTVNGQKADFKAEDITKGIDFTSAETINRTLPKAVRNNEVLRNIVAYEASGRLMMDTDKYVNTYLRGKAEMNDATQRQLNTFIEQATDSQKQAFANALGIADLNTATAADVINGFAEYESSGKAQAQADLDTKVESLVKDAKVKETLPTNIGMQRAEAVRYKNDLYDIGVVKNGAEYILYNYGTGEKTYALSRAQAQNQLTSIKNQETQIRDTQAASEIDTYARNNVEGYATLTEPNKQAIRMTIRQARANNISDEETKTYAQFAARTGINVQFDARELETNKGTADAAALTNRNVIYVNPSDGKTRTYDKILVHELEHFLAKEENGQKLIDEAVKKISQDDFRKVARDYTDLYDKMGMRDMDIISSIVQDEASAKYAETLTNPQVLSYILSKEPSFAEKVVGLFTRTANAYSFNKEMSKEARRFMRTYKKAFDAFAARNEGLNALTLGGETARIGKAEEKAVTSTNEGNAQVTDEKVIRHLALKTVSGIGKVAYIDDDMIKVKPGQTYTEAVKEYFDTYLSGMEIPVETSGESVTIKQKKKFFDKASQTKKQAVQILDDIISIGENKKHSENISVDESGKKKKHTGLSAERGWDYYETKFEIGQKIFSGRIVIRKSADGIDYFYDLDRIKEIDAPVSLTGTESRNGGLKGASIDNSIPDSSEKVNTSGENSSENSSEGKRYALPETDSDGNALTDAQREYFADSKVVDEDGKLLVVYHGSNAQFTKFSYDFMSRNGSSEGQGFYFTDQKSMAEGYQKVGGQLLQGYLNIEKPLSDSSKTLTKKEVEKILKAVDPTGDDVVINYDNSGIGYPSKAWYSRALQEAVNSIYEYADTDSEILGEIANSGGSSENVLQTVRRVLGYDGYIVTDKYENAKVFVAFTQNQFKNASNVTPTEDPDIRYALPADYEATEADKKYLDALNRGDDKAAQKMVEEAAKKAGYNYHGYHFTNNTGENYERFTVFDPRKQGRRDTSTFFHSDIDAAGSYGIYEYDEYLRIDKPLIIDAGGDYWGAVKDHSNAGTMLWKDLSEEQLNYLSKRYDMSVEDVKELWEPDHVVDLIRTGLVETDERDTNEWATYAKRKGFDGVIFENIRDNAESFDDTLGTVYAVFKSSQIKSADTVTYDENGNVIPLSQRFNPDNADIRYALNLSVDQAKAMANMTEGMVYTKKDAESAINSILEDRFVYDDETFAVTGKLSGKSKNEIVEYLAKKLNTAPEGRRAGAALKIADYLLDHVVMEEVFNATDAEDTDTERARNIVNVMKYYKHNIDFSTIKADVVHALDKKGAGVAFMQFSSGENEGVSADYLKASFAEIGVNIETDVESEIFLEAYDIYRKARETLNTKARKEAANLFFNAKERQEKRQQIAKDILNAYQRSGTQSKVSKVIDQYQKQIKSLRSSLEDAKVRNRLENDVSFSAQRLKEIADKHGKISASDTVFPELTAWVKKAAGVNFRGRIRQNVEAVRDVFIGVDGLATFYNENNVLLAGGGEETAVSYLDENVIDALDFIKERYEAKEKVLSPDELHAMNVVLRGMEKLYRTYDKVILNGKQVSLTETAKKGIEIVKKTKNTNTNKFLKGVANNYVKSVVEPRVVIESLEHFDTNGVLTQAFNDITDAETNARWLEMDLMRYIEGFVSKNNYNKHLSNAYVKLNGKDFLTFNQAIDLYLVSKREQAQEGLYEAGIEYTGKDGRTQHRKITKIDIDEIYSQFNEDDKTFIAYLEKFYNVDASKIKFDADNRILGYTNIQDGYYYPIIRAGTTIARSLTNVKDLTKEMRDIYSYSFNKNLRKGAKNELHITDAYSKAQNHAHLLSVYSELTIPLQAFDMLYNKNVGTSTDVQSIRKTVTDDVWSGANSYLRNLMQDIQGSRTTESGWFNRIFSKIRSAGAVASLGANPKVVLSQTSSFPAALTELDMKSLMVSPVVTREDFAEMDKYCRAAAVRNYSRETVKAESVSDKISKPGEVLMKPISWSDRYTIGLLWKASQNQAQADGLGEVGTVENKKAAGKILERVIRKTQPNYTAAERSAWMRDTSTMGEITKGFTMFTSAPLKLLSRFVESSGRLKYALETKTGVKEARQQFNKTLAALLSSMAMYSMIAQFFKWLYRKDRDDDKTFMQDYLSDVALNTIGIFPLVKDVYSLFNEGYEISNFTFDIVNDVLKNVSSVAKLTEKAIGGEAIENWEIGAAMRKVVYSAGQLAGFPTRNINNVFSGLLRRFEPSTAYKYDSMFYNAQYGKDFANAVKDGDEKLASTILSLLMQENAGSSNVSKNALAEMQKLYESGYSVLPKRVPTSYSVTKTDKSGAEVETTEKLTKKQKKAFNAIYAEADAAVDDVIASRYYASLDDEGKARAIKSVYDAYYAKAKQEVLGIEASNSVLAWSKYIGIEKAATIIPRLSRIEGDKDRKGNTISGSKRKNMEKYLKKAGISAREQSFILSMIGYSMDSNGKRKTLQYILSLDISKDEKAEIAEKCGFQVRNGRIIRNF